MISIEVLILVASERLVRLGPDLDRLTRAPLLLYHCTVSLIALEK